MVSQSSSRASLTLSNKTSMPVGKTFKAWLYFSTKDDPMSQKAVCSLGKKEVVRSGETTNLLSHLQKWHREIYNKFFPDSAHGEEEAIRRMLSWSDSKSFEYLLGRK